MTKVCSRNHTSLFYLSQALAELYNSVRKESIISGRVCHFDNITDVPMVVGQFMRELFRLQ